MARIISASRRTDIPRFFARFFRERRRAGEAGFCNVFGRRGTASLRDEDVLGYLFWTRFARPFADNLRALRDDAVAYAVQYTITGYGRDLEPHAPGTSRAVEDFRAVASTLPDPACIQWRYDPIVLSKTYGVAWHRENFARIARELAGATRVVNTSIVEPYRKTIRRVADETVRYREDVPGRHRSARTRHPHLLRAGDDARQLLRELAGIAAEHGMVLRSCCDPELELPPSQCCSAELFAPYGDPLLQRIAALRPRPTRQSCRCLESVDIGMNDTCPAGCRYCYAVASQETAVANFERHDPAGVSLR